MTAKQEQKLASTPKPGSPFLFRPYDFQLGLNDFVSNTSTRIRVEEDKVTKEPTLVVRDVDPQFRWIAVEYDDRLLGLAIVKFPWPAILRKGAVSKGDRIDPEYFRGLAEWKEPTKKPCPCCDETNLENLLRKRGIAV